MMFGFVLRRTATSKLPVATQREESSIGITQPGEKCAMKISMIASSHSLKRFREFGFASIKTFGYQASDAKRFLQQSFGSLKFLLSEVATRSTRNRIALSDLARCEIVTRT